MDRRKFLDRTARYGGAALAATSLPLMQACGGGGELNGNTVVPPLAVKNSYRQTNLADRKSVV